MTTPKIVRALVGVGLAATLALTGVGPAQAASTYKVTIIAVSDKTPRVGDTVKFTGKLTGKTTIKTASLQRRWKGASAWTFVKTATISSNGTFTTTDVMTANTDRYYRIYKAAETGYKSAVSRSVLVDVSAKVGTITAKITTDRESRVFFVGKVNSAGGELTVRVRKSGTTKWGFGSVDVKADGTFNDYIYFGTGKQDFQLYRAATRDVTAATSKTVTLTVHDGVTVVSTKVIPFTTLNVSAPERLACYAPLITTKGVNGLLTTYRDGTTSRQEPVTQVQRVGTKPCSSSAPKLTTIRPASGRLTGGGTVTLTGSGLASVTAVTFTPIAKPDWTITGDGVMPAVPATFDTDSDTSLQVTVPQGLGGATTVTVTSALGKAATSYTYVATWRDPTKQEQAFLDAVNEYRAVGHQCYGDGVISKGAPLTWNGQWADVMESHSIDMVRRYPAYQAMAAAHYDNWLHNAPGVAPHYRLAFAGLSKIGGEVAMGSIGTGGSLTPRAEEAQDAVNAFMNSAGHCAILLNPKATELGAGQGYGLGDSKTVVAFWLAMAG